MGRYANFSYDSGTYEYKFWFGIQDSVIPWARTSEEAWVKEYDEDEAIEYGFTDAQKKLWEEWSETAIAMHDSADNDVIFTLDEQKVLDKCSFTQHQASDDDQNLDSYWEEVHAIIASKKLPPFKFDSEQNIQEQIESYLDAHVDPSVEDKVVASDIHIKLVICCILQKDKSYNCYYEQ
jgi:hypothetical protein